MRQRVISLLRLLLALHHRHHTIVYVISVLSAGVMMVVRSYFAASIGIHDTAFMPMPLFRLPTLRDRADFPLSEFAVAGDIFLYRSPAQSELSLIVTVPWSEKSSIVPLFYPNLAHDVLVCLGGCRPSDYFPVLPPVLASVSLHISQSNSCNFSSETPLDLIGVGSRIFGKFSAMEEFGPAGYPELRISVPAAKLSRIDALLAALNRMENIMVHGPMLFECQGDICVGIPVLYTAFFLVLAAGLFAQVHKVDLRLIAVVGMSYRFRGLVLVCFLYGLCIKTVAESAVVPLLLRQLVCALLEPRTVPASIGAVVGLTFLPPVMMPFLWKTCGFHVLGTALAACGAELRRYYVNFQTRGKEADA
jgi:hypothetical protein